MNSYILFIDDIREVTDIYAEEDTTFLLVRSYDSAVLLFESFGCPTFISFDHDLGEVYDDQRRELNGHRIAHWLVERDMDMKGTFIPDNFSYHVHSANPQGKLNIEGLLDNYLADRIGRIWD
jgi:hypothetical protein